MDMLDGNTAALRAYEAQQERGERIAERGAERAAIEAEGDVYDPLVVAELVYDYEINPGDCLARCFRELDGACRGETISYDAITTALHNLRRVMVAKREAEILDRCIEAEAEYTPCKCRGDCTC